MTPHVPKAHIRKVSDPYSGFTDDRSRKLRLMHKVTGEVVNVKGVSLNEAAFTLNWQSDDIYWVDLGPCGRVHQPDEGPIFTRYFTPPGPRPDLEEGA